jgi:excisionase family DNA binding protein
VENGQNVFLHLDDGTVVTVNEMAAQSNDAVIPRKRKRTNRSSRKQRPMSTREYAEVYTVAEVARLLKTDKSTIYAHCRNNVVPCIRVGNVVRVPGWWIKSQLDPNPEC